MTDRGMKGFKGDSVDLRESSASPIGIKLDRLGRDSFLLADSDDGHPRPEGVGGIIA